MEHLKEALARGRGAIILTAHFTTLEIGARILNAAFPINVLYKPPKNELLAYIANSHRESYKKAEQYTTIERDDIRGMVRALRRNECVWYAPGPGLSQQGRGDGAILRRARGHQCRHLASGRVDRGGRAAVFSRALAARSRAIASRSARRSRAIPARARYADALRFNHFIEAEVRRIPEQYWWIHRRFKGLTGDYPNYYGAAARRT